MAAVLKHWREASTLILVTARQRGSNVLPNFVNSAARDLKGVNLEVLLLKRSAKSKFMPNLYVFPGGVASDVDFSAEWISVFDLLGKDRRHNLFDFVQRGGHGASMFSRRREQRFSEIPSEIAFRISAIRETFEESGVLIAYRVIKSDNSLQPKLWEGPSWASYFEDQTVINEWRKRVDKDAREFLRMCKELRIVPDVWSLYEWSNWLTPIRSTQRFDTSFFVCCIQSRPHVAEDEGETVHSQWGAPYDILAGYQEGSVNLAPPQLYECLRLMRFDTPAELVEFAWRRGQHRVDRFLPIKVKTSDAVLSVLPGDSLYPQNVDPEDESQEFYHDTTLAQLSITHPNVHHLGMKGDADKPAGYKVYIECNIQLPGEHVSPISSSQFITSLKSKM